MGVLGTSYGVFAPVGSDLRAYGEVFGAETDAGVKNSGTPSAQVVFGSWDALGSVLRSFLELFAAGYHLGASLARLGPSWVHLKSILGASLGVLGTPCGVFRTVGCGLRTYGDVFGAENDASLQRFLWAWHGASASLHQAKFHPEFFEKHPQTGCPIDSLHPKLGYPIGSWRQKQGHPIGPGWIWDFLRPS